LLYVRDSVLEGMPGLGLGLGLMFPLNMIPYSTLVAMAAVGTSHWHNDLVHQIVKL